jgi:hypothetical protein
VVVLFALLLVLVGPTLAEKLGQSTGWGAPFEWTWLVLQWPLVFAVIAVGIGLISTSDPMRSRTGRGSRPVPSPPLGSGDRSPHAWMGDAGTDVTGIV